MKFVVNFIRGLSFNYKFFGRIPENIFRKLFLEFWSFEGSD
jgi:hypothetical protein